MMVQNDVETSTKCYKCNIIIANDEDSYYCIYCNEGYCPDCLGYSKYYHMDEMDELLDALSNLTQGG